MRKQAEEILTICGTDSYHVWAEDLEITPLARQILDSMNL